MPPSPRSRSGRRAVRAVAAIALAGLAITAAGCDYEAGIGSYATGSYLGCGGMSSYFDSTCTGKAQFNPVVLYDDSRRPIAVESFDVIGVDRKTGESISLMRRPTDFPNPIFGYGIWHGYLSLEDLAPAAPVAGRFFSIPRGAGLFTSRWVLTQQLPKVQASAVPEPVAALFSHDAPGATGPADKPLLATIIDARQSTGRSISYSWDTNGDGVYGDDVQGGWAGSPAPTAGTAYIPLAVLETATSTQPLTPRVKVTDSFGRTSTAGGTLRGWTGGAGSMQVASSGDQTSITPLLGTLPYDHHDGTTVQYACVDVGDDGTYESAPLRYQYEKPTPAFVTASVPNWTGTRRVRVTFLSAPMGWTTCDAPTEGSQVLSTHTELMDGTTKSLMEWDGQRQTAKARAYAATARVRLAGGALLSPGKQSGTSAAGVVNNGRFSLRTPAKAGRVKRPPALALFRAGQFASTSNAELGLSADGATTLVGSTTMVIRGTQKALACLRVAQTDSSTTWTVIGGTGAARTLKMTLTGGPTLNEMVSDALPPTTPVKGRGTNATRALSPVTTGYTIMASTGSGRGLNATCRALVKRLP